MKKHLVIIFLAFFYTAAVLPVHAAELGKTFFQGKTIVLNDDGTWSYTGDTAVSTPSPSQANTPVCSNSSIVPVSFCLNTSQWSSSSKPSEDYEYFYSNAVGSLYFGVITEGLPLTNEFFKNSILDNAGNAAQGGRDKVTVLKDTTVNLNGQTWNNLEYAIYIDGLKFRYNNYYTSIGDRGSIQVLFFTLDDVFEKFRPDMDEIVKTVKVNF